MSRVCTPPPQLPSLQSRRAQEAIQLVREMTHAQLPLHDLLPQTRADNTNRLLQNSNNFTLRPVQKKQAESSDPAYSGQTEWNKRWIAEVFEICFWFCLFVCVCVVYHFLWHFKCMHGCMYVYGCICKCVYMSMNVWVYNFIFL